MVFDYDDEEVWAEAQILPADRGNRKGTLLR